MGSCCSAVRRRVGVDQWRFFRRCDDDRGEEAPGSVAGAFGFSRFAFGAFRGRGKRGAEVRYADPKVMKFPAKAGVYPWHFDVTATVFWIGEAPTVRNKTPNHKSSWDQLWQVNYGGFDHPDTEFRTEDFVRRGLCRG